MADRVSPKAHLFSDELSKQCIFQPASKRISERRLVMIAGIMKLPAHAKRQGRKLENAGDDGSLKNLLLTKKTSLPASLRMLHQHE
eukprot:scaffold1717_cov117-Cylindrotheca_fusiformis.AAC.5